MAKLTSIGLITLAMLSQGCKSYDAMQGYPAQKAKVGTEIKALSALVAKTETDFETIDASKDIKARNSYIFNRKALIDLEYDIMIKRAGAIKTGIDTGKDIAVGAMGAAGAIVGGGTAQALSAAVAATTAGAVAIDKNYFYNSTMPTMIAAMNAGRQKIYVGIAIGLSKNYTDYPIGSAFSDLNDYYFAGTLTGAQNNINQSSGKTAAGAATDTANAPDIATALKNQTEGKSLTPAQDKALRLYQSR